MSPDDDSPVTTDNPLNSERPLEAVPNPKTGQINSQQAAANVIRSQIENLYGHPTASQSIANPQPIEDVNPYARTHESESRPVLDQWKQYHSAWQTYYQKYYEGYYTHHLGRALAAQPSAAIQGYFTRQPKQESPEETVSKDEALFDLRQKLLAQVTNSAKKVRKSRHFIPISAAVLVVLAFSFLQYNRILIANVMAYVSPGNIDPQNIVIDPTTDITVLPESRLIIPKINVDVPVLYDVGSDYDSQMTAMEKGVAHFAIPGANSHPGQTGNTVLSGHSSNDLLDQGDYKFIFAQLDKLSVGDSIYLNYHSKRYTYTISRKEVVEPSEVNKLVYPTNGPVLTLITCTPLGTALHRLLITAEQVSPDPSAAVPAPAAPGAASTGDIPGSSPTLFERIFGTG
jgi:sortase A